jgi:hypothetical protein
MPLEIDSSDGILELKERIENQKGIAIVDQHLFLSGRELFNGFFVRDYSIQDGVHPCLICSGTNDGEPNTITESRERDAQIGRPIESFEVRIHDLDSNTISLVVVGRRERIGGVRVRFVPKLRDCELCLANVA